MQLDIAAGDMQPPGRGVLGVVGIIGSEEERGLYHSLSTTRGLRGENWLRIENLTSGEGL